VLFDVDVAGVFEPADVEVDGVDHLFAGYVDVAARVGVCGPVCLGDVLGVVGEGRVVAVVAGECQRYDYGRDCWGKVRESLREVHGHDH
jgi:hypothetical protein